MSWLKEARRIVNRFLAHRQAAPFLEPVDLATAPYYLSFTDDTCPSDFVEVDERLTRTEQMWRTREEGDKKDDKRSKITGADGIRDCRSGSRTKSNIKGTATTPALQMTSARRWKMRRATRGQSGEEADEEEEFPEVDGDNDGDECRRRQKRRETVKGGRHDEDAENKFSNVNTLHQSSSSSSSSCSSSVYASTSDVLEDIYRVLTSAISVYNGCVAANLKSFAARQRNRFVRARALLHVWKAEMARIEIKSHSGPRAQTASPDSALSSIAVSTSCVKKKSAVSSKTMPSSGTRPRTRSRVAPSQSKSKANVKADADHGSTIDRMDRSVGGRRTVKKAVFVKEPPSLSTSSVSASISSHCASVIVIEDDEEEPRETRSDVVAAKKMTATLSLSQSESEPSSSSSSKALSTSETPYESSLSSASLSLSSSSSSARSESSSPDSEADTYRRKRKRKARMTKTEKTKTKVKRTAARRKRKTRKARTSIEKAEQDQEKTDETMTKTGRGVDGDEEWKKNKRQRARKSRQKSTSTRNRRRRKNSSDLGTEDEDDVGQSPKRQTGRRRRLRRLYVPSDEDDEGNTDEYAAERGLRADDCILDGFNVSRGEAIEDDEEEDDEDVSEFPSSLSGSAMVRGEMGKLDQHRANADSGRSETKKSQMKSAKSIADTCSTLLSSSSSSASSSSSSSSSMLSFTTLLQDAPVPLDDASSKSTNRRTIPTPHPPRCGGSVSVATITTSSSLSSPSLSVSSSLPSPLCIPRRPAFDAQCTSKAGAAQVQHDLDDEEEGVDDIVDVDIDSDNCGVALETKTRSKHADSLKVPNDDSLAADAHVRFRHVRRAKHQHQCPATVGIGSIGHTEAEDLRGYVSNETAFTCNENVPLVTSSSVSCSSSTSSSPSSSSSVRRVSLAEPKSAAAASCVGVCPKLNQDAYILREFQFPVPLCIPTSSSSSSPVPASSRMIIFGVADGHGQYGHTASFLVREIAPLHLFTLLSSSSSSSSSSTSITIEEAIQQTCLYLHDSIVRYACSIQNVKSEFARDKERSINVVDASVCENESQRNGTRKETGEQSTVKSMPSMPLCEGSTGDDCRESGNMVCNESATEEREHAISASSEHAKSVRANEKAMAPSHYRIGFENDYGTTLCLCVWLEGHAHLYVANVGDSRCVVIHPSLSSTKHKNKQAGHPISSQNAPSVSVSSFATTLTGRSACAVSVNKSNDLSNDGEISASANPSRSRQLLRRTATLTLDHDISSEAAASSSSSSSLQSASVTAVGSGKNVSCGERNFDSSSRDAQSQFQSQSPLTECVANGWQLSRASRDHNPTQSPSECCRLRECGARVYNTGRELRVAPGDISLAHARQHYLTLNMSRALGHRILSQYGVCSDPDITYVSLSFDDSFSGDVVSVSSSSASEKAPIVAENRIGDVRSRDLSGDATGSGAKEETEELHRKNMTKQPIMGDNEVSVGINMKREQDFTSRASADGDAFVTETTAVDENRLRRVASEYVILCCSDGVFDAVSDEELLRICMEIKENGEEIRDSRKKRGEQLLRSSRIDLHGFVRRVLVEAQRGWLRLYGGAFGDNITAVAVRFGG